MKFESEKIWCGTEDSLQCAIDAQMHATNLQASGKLLADFELDPVWHSAGSTAVITINGSLVNGSAGFMRMFGVIGYNDIRGAIAEALTDQNIKNILLDINSGGGQVSGLSDLGDFIKMAGAVKPIHTYADGSMGSAAYWLGAIGKTLTITDTTLAGSIGALQMHVERSEALKQMGVKATIIRSGEWKGLGSAVEPLAEKAAAEMQSQVNDINTTFVAHIAKMRNSTPEKVEANMGKGRVFLGQRAVDVGLVDRVGNYESALSALTDKTNKSGQRAASLRADMTHNSENPEQGKHMKVTLKPEQLQAAIAAGIVLEGVTAVELTAEEQAAETLRLEAAEATRLAAEAAANTPEAKALAEAEATRLAAASATTPATQAVADFLRGELADTRTSLATAQNALTIAEARVTEMSATSDGMTEVVRKSLATMKIALNQPAEGVSTLAGEALLAEHKRCADAFQAAFKIGGVAATSAEDAPVAAKAIDPEFLARLGKTAKA